MDIPNNLRVILIAEDSPTQAENLRYFLEQHGYQVISARNGREAIDLITRYNPDLLISDIVMPEIDGYELCRRIRHESGLKDLPVIFLTVLSDPADIMKSLECGADGFIIKPFKEEPLLERIRLLFDSGKLRNPEEEQEPVEVVFHGKKYQVTADRLQIMNLLVSTYEAAVETNSELLRSQRELQNLGAELQEQNNELSNLTEVLRDSKARTQRQAQILTAINCVFHEAIISETEEELGRTCLAAAEELTDSRFGFLGEINEAGRLNVIAVSDPGWTACRMPGITKPILPKDLHIRGVFGKAITEERSVIANDPAAHPDSVGTPEGHPEFTAFLVVPLKQAGKTIGLLGLGNKPGGYDQADQEAAEMLAPAIVESFLRKRAESRIKELNQQLVDHVHQLEAANNELESFSYSVSHDLRAPLRGIAGFARILSEDYREKLNAKGLEYLQLLQEASDQMNALIEALLSLSRVSQAEMRRQVVDLSTLARAITENLKRAEPERQVEFIIPDGIVARGDPTLLQILLANLLGNAWKFTGKKPQTRIEFGVQNSGGRKVYRVKDNGVGFDPKFAGKLFGAFKRLHAANEFPGTGIGLATVQRVINRHGGQIWAEAAINHGAVFYFTLGTDQSQ
ncbi:MAG: response regulator [Deltaproteobacteria bacterium]|nr:response regulator [Deltaproteobacteria bacterium]